MKKLRMKTLVFTLSTRLWAIESPNHRVRKRRRLMSSEIISGRKKHGGKHRGRSKQERGSAPPRSPSRATSCSPAPAHYALKVGSHSQQGDVHTQRRPVRCQLGPNSLDTSCAAAGTTSGYQGDPNGKNLHDGRFHWSHESRPNRVNTPRQSSPRPFASETSVTEQNVFYQRTGEWRCSARGRVLLRDEERRTNEDIFKMFVSGGFTSPSSITVLSPLSTSLHLTSRSSFHSDDVVTHFIHKALRRLEANVCFSRAEVETLQEPGAIEDDGSKLASALQQHADLSQAPRGSDSSTQNRSVCVHGKREKPRIQLPWCKIANKVICPCSVKVGGVEERRDKHSR
ncbi:unnamed protein product [Pleuronectes platessa]|uniref:Uncharacterized protein n=1 Tax=Pleuronectes platessa TaxID=8262 RepID=A0A9N7VYD2_PLEPL|nr:unnamed protein product [Pleuronectes platessa]